MIVDWWYVHFYHKLMKCWYGAWATITNKIKILPWVKMHKSKKSFQYSYTNNYRISFLAVFPHAYNNLYDVHIRLCALGWYSLENGPWGPAHKHFQGGGYFLFISPAVELLYYRVCCGIEQLRGLVFQICIAAHSYSKRIKASIITAVYKIFLMYILPGENHCAGKYGK